MPPIGFGNPDELTPAHRQEQGPCYGCSQWMKCLFHMRKLGGFKGKPRAAARKNVGYRLICDATERRSAKEDFMSCEAFVEVMQDRMLTGQALRNEGKDGEIVTVIAQEGETIKKRFQVAINARNEVVRPMQHLIEPLRNAGHKLNLDDLAGTIDYKHVTLDMVVPAYPTWQDTVRSDYASEIADRERKREAVEDDVETAIWEAAREKQQAEELTPVASPVPKASASPAK